MDFWEFAWNRCSASRTSKFELTSFAPSISLWLLLMLKHSLICCRRLWLSREGRGLGGAGCPFSRCHRLTTDYFGLIEWSHGRILPGLLRASDWIPASWDHRMTRNLQPLYPGWILRAAFTCFAFEAHHPNLSSASLLNMDVAAALSDSMTWTRPSSIHYLNQFNSYQEYPNCFCQLAAVIPPNPYSSLYLVFLKCLGSCWEVLASCRCCFRDCPTSFSSCSHHKVYSACLLNHFATCLTKHYRINSFSNLRSTFLICQICVMFGFHSKLSSLSDHFPLFLAVDVRAVLTISSRRKSICLGFWMSLVANCVQNVIWSVTQH